MANKSDFTYEQLGRVFRSYLSECFDGDAQEVSLTIETAERIIPNTLNDYFGTQYESIYDITEIDDVEELRKKIKTHPILKNLDMSVEPRYTEVLKWYRLFLKALNANAVPMPVYGEYDDTNYSSGTKTAEPPVTPKPTVENTIFLEGEAEEAQPRKSERETRYSDKLASTIIRPYMVVTSSANVAVLISPRHTILMTNILRFTISNHSRKQKANIL